MFTEGIENALNGIFICFNVLAFVNLDGQQTRGCQQMRCHCDMK